MRAPFMTMNPPEAAVRQLLHDADLPASDITTAKLATFFACGSGDEIWAVVGLELYSATALLRSLVVSPPYRSRGLGAALVAHAETAARARGVTVVYLLTTTAASFFVRLGYQAVGRDAAPPEIRQTTEFSSLCPASSAFMMKRLSDAG